VRQRAAMRKIGRPADHINPCNYHPAQRATNSAPVREMDGSVKSVARLLITRCRYKPRVVPQRDNPNGFLALISREHDS